MRKSFIAFCWGFMVMSAVGAVLALAYNKGHPAFLIGNTLLFCFLIFILKRQDDERERDEALRELDEFETLVDGLFSDNESLSENNERRFHHWLSIYWDAAYEEGQKGATQDNELGWAGRALHELTEMYNDQQAKAEAAEIKLQELRNVLGPRVPDSVTDQGARYEWSEALRILGGEPEDYTL